MSDYVVHRGACHCGQVRFEVDAPAELPLVDCNCSVCAIVGFLHLIVPLDRFRLIAGAEVLSEYRFGTGVARHTFCSRCGVKPFYTPRSHPDQISVNVRCIDPSTIRGSHVTPFDGRDWERARPGLA